METWARIVNNVVAEVTTHDPSDFPASLIFAPIPDGVVVQQGYLVTETADGWAFSTPPAVVAAPVPIVQLKYFLARFTPTQQAALASAMMTTPALLMFFLTHAGSTVDVTAASTIAIVATLVSLNVIAQANVAAILSTAG